MAKFKFLNDVLDGDTAVKIDFVGDLTSGSVKLTTKFEASTETEFSIKDSYESEYRITDSYEGVN